MQGSCTLSTVLTLFNPVEFSVKLLLVESNLFFMSIDILIRISFLIILATYVQTLEIVIPPVTGTDYKPLRLMEDLENPFKFFCTIFTKASSFKFHMAESYKLPLKRM